jgi:hypothetical protein
LDGTFSVARIELEINGCSPCQRPLEFCTKADTHD